jgi:dolichol-phosphate mannosyltransferase
MEEMHLSVIVPVYNEATTIEAIVRRIAEVPLEKEILVVDDGSTDGTRVILQNLQKDTHNLPLSCFFHEKNMGKGAAIRTALANTTGQVIVIQDADL